MTRFTRFNENRFHSQEGERLLDLFHRPGNSRPEQKAQRPVKSDTATTTIQDAGETRRSASA
jgi:hypothetical protein